MFIDPDAIATDTTFPDSGSTARIAALILLDDRGRRAADDSHGARRSRYESHAGFSFLGAGLPRG
jgi:hypothetical protein